MTESRTRLRRFGKALLINGSLLLASFLFAVIVGEVAVRLVMPQQLIQIRPDLWQPADSVGWLHRPNVETEMNTGERTVSVYTDSAGFRVGAAGRVEQGLPVLILGDSFMEALQVEYEQSLAGILQERLPDAIGQPVAVRNGGIDGWSPSHYLLRASSVLPRDEYRLVVIGIYLGNDVLPARFDYVPPRTPVARARFHFPQGLRWKELTEAILLPVNDALEVRSHLYTLVKNRLQTLRMRAGLSPLYLPQEFLRREADSDRWSLLGDICAEIDGLASASGASTVFVLIPAPFQVDEAEFDRYVRGFDIDPATVDLDQPSRLVREQLAARDLHVIDATSAFKRAHGAGSRLYGRIDPHLTPAGHMLLAELLMPTAAALLSQENRALSE